MADLLFAARLFGVALIVLMLCGIVTALVILCADPDPDDADPPRTQMQREWELYNNARREGSQETWADWQKRKEQV